MCSKGRCLIAKRERHGRGLASHHARHARNSSRARRISRLQHQARISCAIRATVPVPTSVVFAVLRIRVPACNERRTAASRLVSSFGGRLRVRFWSRGAWRARHGRRRIVPDGGNSNLSEFGWLSKRNGHASASGYGHREFCHVRDRGRSAIRIVGTSISDIPAGKSRIWTWCGYCVVRSAA